MSHGYWTTRRIEVLRTLRAKGRTYEVCAHVIGCSRSAIAGGVRRHIDMIPDLRSNAQKNAHKKHRVRKGKVVSSNWNERTLTETWAERKMRKQGELGK